MQTSDESFDYTQRAFNFLESVRNADQTFNETNDDSYIFPRYFSESWQESERLLFHLMRKQIKSAQNVRVYVKVVNVLAKLSLWLNGYWTELF